jgi:hypothetical protein
MTATRSNIPSNVLGKAGTVRYESNIRSIEHEFDRLRSTAMSTVTIAFPDLTQSPEIGPIRTGRQDLAGRRSGRGLAPQSRPGRSVPAPSLTRHTRRPSVQACTAEPVPASWRLTDRGVAVILATGLLILLAALVVVGLTAVRVTGSDYVPRGAVELVHTDAGAQQPLAGR